MRRCKGRGRARPVHSDEQEQLGKNLPDPISHPEPEHQNEAQSSNKVEADSEVFQQSSAEENVFEVRRAGEESSGETSVKALAVMPRNDSVLACSSSDIPIQRAQRPERSSSFKKEIAIVSNLFRLNCNMNTIYHYDVEIIRKTKKRVPDEELKSLGKSLSHAIVSKWIFQCHLDECSPIYDGGKNLYTCKPLPFSEFESEISIPFANEERNFLLFVKPVVKNTSDNTVDMTVMMKYAEGMITVIPNEINAVLEAILSYRQPNFPQINFGNCFYFTNNIERQFNVGFGCEMWSGYSQNIRFTGQGAAIVINTAMTAFHKTGSVVDIMSEILQKDVKKVFLNKKDVVKLSKKLKLVKIFVTHQKQKRKYRIECFVDTPASHLRFLMDHGAVVTVEGFFFSRYGLKLRYPHLPCMKMCSSKNDLVFLPPEVCEIVPNQRAKGNLDEKVTANVIRQAALAPGQKFEMIQKDALSICDISSAPMKQYGIEMNVQPIETTARVLEQPCIQYHSDKCTLKDNGVWDMNNQNFFSGASAENPLLISFADIDVSVLDRFADIMCKAGKKAGLTMSKPWIKCYDSSFPTEKVIEEASRLKADLVFVVLSKFDTCHSYEEVKFFADTKFGIVSQCLNVEVVKKTCEKIDMRTANNICLKINAKLGGVNHEISEWPMALRKEEVIIMGADVIHHVGDDFPSIAALVGCVDPSVFRYTVSCKALANPKFRQSQEIILTLEEMVKSVLLSYYRQNSKRKPQKILFYRDGISAGQFQHILGTEIPMIKKACQSLEDDYRPPLTYVVVQKRHPVRIRPKYEEDGLGKCRNVPPGTVADKDIVDPQLYEFYLCSHEGMQGTSKPTHYTVLFDENRVRAEVIENLTYYLCHVFARCNHSISIPAPVKYADLLCARASDYVKTVLKRRTAKKTCSREYNNREIPKDISDVINSIEKVPHSMFFI